MPSVVMVNAVCSGSHGRIMSDIGRAAQAAGFRTHIAFARGAANGADIRIGSMRDVYLHVAATRLLDRHGRASRRATERLTRQLADLRPDVLHLHNAHGYYLHYETFFAFLRQSGIPTVWTLHDCWAVTGHCSHFVRANCMRWRDGCHRCPLRREYPQSWLWDASRENWRRKRDAFSALPNLTLALPSRWLEGVVADSFLRDVPRRVIPNGVDLSLFSPRGDGGQTRSALGIGPEEPLLLAVAAPFDARKGYAGRAGGCAQDAGARARCAGRPDAGAAALAARRRRRACAHRGARSAGVAAVRGGLPAEPPPTRIRILRSTWKPWLPERRSPRMRWAAA